MTTLVSMNVGHTMPLTPSLCGMEVVAVVDTQGDLQGTYPDFARAWQYIRDWCKDIYPSLVGEQSGKNVLVLDAVTKTKLYEIRPTYFRL